MKEIHFREGKNQQWIIFHDNYNFSNTLYFIVSYFKRTKKHSESYNKHQCLPYPAS